MVLTIGSGSLSLFLASYTLEWGISEDSSEWRRLTCCELSDSLDT